MDDSINVLYKQIGKVLLSENRSVQKIIFVKVIGFDDMREKLHATIKNLVAVFNRSRFEDEDPYGKTMFEVGEW